MASRRAGTGLLYRFYERRLSREIARAAVPRHIAMIIDGNRRWARLNALATVGHGHRAGAAKMQEFLGWCDGFGVEVVTLYLLSNDNVANRDAEEVEELCAIIADLADALSTGTGWRIRHVGHSGALPPALADALAGAAERSRSESGMQVNLAVGYGGRHEVVEAIRRILESHEGPTADLAERLSPELIGEHLYTTGQPDPDLVIRTSGEQRLSDFMLWQSAHSEFYFMEALGPDMREVDFLRALRDYGTRSRRFGR